MPADIARKSATSRNSEKIDIYDPNNFERSANSFRFDQDVSRVTDNSQISTSMYVKSAKVRDEEDLKQEPAKADIHSSQKEQDNQPKFSLLNESSNLQSS